jgi:hypothetical protein
VKSYSLKTLVSIFHVVDRVLLIHQRKKVAHVSTVAGEPASLSFQVELASRVSRADPSVRAH